MFIWRFGISILIGTLITATLVLPTVALASLFAQPKPTQVATQAELPANISIAANIDPSLQQQIRAFFGSANYDWTALGPIAISPLTASPYCAYTQTSTQTIYLQNKCPDATLAAVLAHELGHIADHALMNSHDRDQFCQEHAIHNCATWYNPTYSDSATTDATQSPAEIFASNFARQFFN